MTDRQVRVGPEPQVDRSGLVARYSLTVAATCEMPGVDSAEAWRRADVVRREVRNVLATHGIPEGDPLVNVWDDGITTFPKEGSPDA